MGYPRPCSCLACNQCFLRGNNYVQNDFVCNRGITRRKDGTCQGFRARKLMRSQTCRNPCSSLQASAQRLPEDIERRHRAKNRKITAPFGISKKNCHIKAGKPYEVICKEAEKRKADLVILGTHSKKALQAAIIGSTATGVSNNAKCDVTLFRL